MVDYLMETKEIQLKKCFYITPIGEKKSIQFEKLEGLEQNVLKPVLEQQGYELEIAHTIDSPGSISDQIFERIVKYELVIVNLTGLNPNVMYELAVRHSFGMPCIIICEVSTNLPFDLLAERTIFYEDTIKGSGELKEELIKKITSSKGSETDNPVTRAVSKAKIMESAADDPLKIILSEINSLGIKMEKYENESTYISNRAKHYSESRLPIIKSTTFMEAYHKLKDELGEDVGPKEIAEELGVPLLIAQNTYSRAIYKGLI